MYLILIFTIAMANVAIGYATAEYCRSNRLPLLPRFELPNWRLGRWRQKGIDPLDMPIDALSGALHTVSAEELTATWREALESQQSSEPLEELGGRAVLVAQGHYRTELTLIDMHTRGAIDNRDTESLVTCERRLRAVASEQLVRDAELTARLNQSRDQISNEGTQAWCGRLAQQLEQQDNAIHSALTALDGCQPFEDVAVAGPVMIAQVGKLLQDCQSLRDKLHVEVATLAREQGRMARLPQSQCNDELTGLLNRVGISVVLERLAVAPPDPTRRCSVALLNLDHFSHVNHEFGVAVGDEILARVAHAVKQNGPTTEQDAAARYDGQQFLIYFATTGPRNAMPIIERIRQIVENTTFDFQGARISVTLSCGVTDVRPGEPAAELLQRLEQTTLASRRSGGNQTMIDDGQGPQPVKPPDFELPPQVLRIKLDALAASLS